MPDPNGVWLLTLVFPSTRSILLKWNCAAACVIVEKNPHPQAKNSPLPSQLLSATWQEIWMLDLFKAKQSERCTRLCAPLYLRKARTPRLCPPVFAMAWPYQLVSVYQVHRTQRKWAHLIAGAGGEGLLLRTYIGITYIGTQYINKPPSLLSSAQYWCSSWNERQNGTII